MLGWVVAGFCSKPWARLQWDLHWEQDAMRLRASNGFRSDILAKLEGLACSLVCLLTEAILPSPVSCWSSAAWPASKWFRLSHQPLAVS